MEQLTPPHDFGMADAHHQGWPTSFRLTHCSKEGRMTPPSSPTQPSRNGSKLQLSELLRRSKLIKSKQSGLPQDEIRTRPSANNMKGPFPLTLPALSSIVADSSSNVGPPYAELRRMSASYNNLRVLAQHRPVSSPVIPLFPSPIARDSPRESESYFKFHNPRHRPHTASSNDSSVDSFNILSYYCDDPTDSLWQPEDESPMEHSSCREALEDDNQSTASESMPATPLQQEYQPTFCTDESDWLANTTSRDQRMRRFKSRYYQIVQQPWKEIHSECGENKVMIATVLVGPGKPKLVHIHRPPSKSGTDSSVESLHTPSTPKRVPLEVSAFSPFDTPSELPPRVDSIISRGTSTAIQELATSFLPQPLALLRRSRSSRSENIFGTWQRFQDLADPFETSPRRTRSNQSFRATEKRWAIRGTANIDTQVLREPSPITRSATWSRCRKSERTLNAVTRAIDQFPDNMLQLDSPAVLELRNPQISDRTYTMALQRVFPAAAPVLISALTAWIIVDLYFSRLRDQPLPMERYLGQAAAPQESLHRIPNKAREMLGIGLPDAASIYLNDYALRRRASAIEASIRVVGQRLVEALRGSWDEDIWRSLRVLVEVIECSPQRWA
ncbi:hypothetical protein A1O7_00007 [Cladophialophora yegresii CBS 114405]|uniref:Uncharacterized protein n=1 Tax=Cladophialophora yegresii CBS 114405 TaxID=1182544 RepID=W9W6E9_9EURO|nr:uncharacterized protein A1O7_00007 [Cladophialophora yegresii CBS 114405]EXJ63672.1 hypothetical protein A1O7_00007 [Cladophialophora yegresii CBS 114405]